MVEQSRLILNVAPISFSRMDLVVGHLPTMGEAAYHELRRQHWATHVFRFDNRTQDITNVAVAHNTRPLGTIERTQTDHYFLLLGYAITRSLVLWLGPGLPIIRGQKNLLFWGQKAEAQLLTRACQQANVPPTPGLEVRLRYHVDCRLFKDQHDKTFLGAVLDVDTANILDMSVADLVALGLDVGNLDVCRRAEREQLLIYPRLEELGRIVRQQGSEILIAGPEGEILVDSSIAVLAPRTEYLHAIIRLLYGTHSDTVLDNLEQVRAPVASSSGRLGYIERTLASFNREHIVVADGLGVRFADLLRKQQPLFPESIVTSRPPLLFGPQGRNIGQYPDEGIRTHGPYMYMQHPRTQPLIAVVCEARRRGQVEQFMDALRTGFPDTSWRGQGVNPFRGGLIGKFRLMKVRIEYEECSAPTAEAYRRAAQRLLQRMPEVPDLAFVQISEDFKKRRVIDNPYYASKAAFMAAGVPTQSVMIEKMQIARSNTAYLLNNIAVATYAKLDGMPWVIATPGSTTHELVLGIGSSEVITANGRTRYVGLTTLFQGDGRYLVWGLTHEVRYEDYPAALLASLQTVIRHMETQNAWEHGDKLRLVCHVYKRLKDAEVNAVKSLVRELVSEQFQVEFAFLDISWAHPYRLFAPSQPGVPIGRYTTQIEQPASFKGVGVPARGTCLLLDTRRVLLHLVGPNELKAQGDGLPAPLLIELHPDSDFTDMTYLARQLFHFSYASWRGFLPSSNPVTIAYSQRIASMLGSLNLVPGWDSTNISLGPLRGRLWFL